MDNPVLGDICTFRSRIFGGGEEIEHSLPLLNISEKDPECVLYEFETACGRKLAVRREAITEFKKPEAKAEPVKVVNPDSFTEFLFNKVVQFRQDGKIPEDDPVYKFSRKFFQELGWPIEAQHREDFRAFLIKKLYKEFFSLPLDDVMAALESKQRQDIKERLQHNVDEFINRIFELDYVLTLAWNDYQADIGVTNPQPL